MHNWLVGVLIGVGILGFTIAASVVAGLAAPSPFSVHRSGGNCVYVLGNDIEVVAVGPEGC